MERKSLYRSNLQIVTESKPFTFGHSRSVAIIPETIAFEKTYNLPIPKGRSPSPRPPFRTQWHPRRLQQVLGTGSTTGSGPDFNNKLIGEGEVVYLSEEYGIIESCSGNQILFEVNETLWPNVNRSNQTMHDIQKNDIVTFEAIHWPKPNLKAFGSPNYEATTVRVIHLAMNRPIDWKGMCDVTNKELIPQSISGNGKVWYLGSNCSLMFDLNSKTNIFFYTHLKPDVKMDECMDFIAVRKERFIPKHHIWTFYDAVKIIKSG